MYVGVDLGGTHTAAAIVDDKGQILKRIEAPTRAKDGEEAVVGDIIRACKTLIKDAGKPMRSIGIGVPGSVRSDIGRVVFTPNLPLRDVDLTSHLSKELNCKVYLCNDANCAALGETVAGSGKGCANFAMITLGTGLGGGLIVGGKLLTGASGAAGEVGHIVISARGRKCGCGRVGCWETYASATGLVNTALGFLRKDRDSLIWKLCNGHTGAVNGRTIFNAYREKDKTAILIVNKYIEHLAIGIADLINILEPEVFCIGGGISNAWDCIEDALKAAVGKEKFTRFSTGVKQTKLVRAQLGNDAGIIGAAMLGRE